MDKAKLPSWGKKTLMVTKFDNQHKNQPITKEIQNCFDDYKQYLTANPTLIVGRRIRGPRFDSTLKPVPYSIVGPINIFNEPKITSRRSTMKRASTMSLSGFSQKKTIGEKNQKQPSPLFDEVDDTKLKAIFNEYFTQRTNNTHSNQEESLPQDIAKELKSQEKSLLFHSNELKNVQNVSKYLSKRTNKPEADLLINRIDGYPVKRQIINSMDANIPIEEKFGNCNWSISLRRPEKFTGTRRSYINLGSSEKPLWLGVTETHPKSIEIIRKPNSNDTDYKTFTSTPYLKDIEKNRKSLKTLESLADVGIQGKDLLQCEFDIAKALQAKKIMYRKDYLDSIVTISNTTMNTIDLGNVAKNRMPQVYLSHYKDKSKSMLKSRRTLSEQI